VTAQNPTSFLISIVGRDQTGVVSAVTGYLFEIGANLADSSFAVLGEAFEFSCVATFGSDISREDVETGLAELEQLSGARITVSAFQYDLMRGAGGEITHLVEIKGGDRPGLVAGISEVLMAYDANIVRMSSRRVPLDDGALDYRTRFAVNVPEGRAAALEAALYNTAGSLRLECSLEAVD